jgi:hypothetical protein
MFPWRQFGLLCHFTDRGVRRSATSDSLNDAVGQKRSLHPGASDIAYLAAYDQGKFRQMHDEIFASFRVASNPQ